MSKKSSEVKKRRILKVVIKADKDIKYRSFEVGNSNQLSRDQIIETMLEAGVWPFIRQRPYDIIANPKDMPKAILFLHSIQLHCLLTMILHYTVWKNFFKRN